MFTYINVKETYFFSHTVHYCSFSIHIRSECSFFMPVSLRNGFRVCWVYPVCWLDSSHRPEQALATIFLEVSPPSPQCSCNHGRVGGVAEGNDSIVVTLWHHDLSKVLTAHLKAQLLKTQYIFLCGLNACTCFIIIKKKENSNSHYIQYGTFNCRKLLVMDHLILGLHLVREV